jgi:hypothetical protein
MVSIFCQGFSLQEGYQYSKEGSFNFLFEYEFFKEDYKNQICEVREPIVVSKSMLLPFYFYDNHVDLNFCEEFYVKDQCQQL